MTSLAMNTAGEPRETAGATGADLEVPRMTSDIYYGFAAKPFFDSLCKPDGPVRGRRFRSTYEMAGGGLEIVGGPGLFNRPLFTPGCRTLVNAGDRPALILWTASDYPKPGSPEWGRPDWLGHFFAGLSLGGVSRWLHTFAECRAHFHPGWVEYRLRDPAFPGLETQVDILPHASGAVWINVMASLPPDAAESPVLVWTHGCIGCGSTDRSQHYDPGTELFARVDWDEPHLAANDSVEFHGDLAVIRDADDPANWVAVGSTRKPSELLATNAGQRLDIAPDALRAHPPAGRPAAAGRVLLDIEAGGQRACSLIVNWGRNTDPVAVMRPLLAASAERISEAQRHFQHRTERIAIRTPDPALDTAFRFAVVAADGMWHPPGINHAPYAWSGLTTIFRTFYGLTVCGDHARVASALRLHGQVDIHGRLKNLAGGVGQEPFASGYQSYGSTVDMLWHHHLWSDDKELLKEWQPVVDSLIACQERDRKDARGLFIDHLGFWASDSFNYHEGCATGTAFVWRLYTVRGWMAEALGEDPAPFRRRADEIRSLLFGLLWNEEGGYLHDVVGATGERQPTTIAPAIYHAIEYSLVTGRQAERMFDWLETHLLSPAGMVRVNDWFPIRWSHHIYSPNETGNAAVAAYRLRRADTGYRMLHAIARGTIERTLVPGAIMCLSSSDGALINGTDFGDGVSLFLRANVEGLFGLRLDKPHGVLRLEPNFPRNWLHADLTLPGLGQMTFRREPVADGVRDCYSLTLDSPLRLSASLPAGGPAREVRVNGRPAAAASQSGRTGFLVEVEAPADTRFEIRFESAASAPVSPEQLPVVAAAATLSAAPPQPATSGQRAEFESVALGGAAVIPFERAYRLFPGEQLWNLDYPKTPQPRSFMLDSRFSGYPAEWRLTRKRIPFRIDRQAILAFQKRHADAIWGAPPLYALDFSVPGTLTLPIGRSAAAVYVLASGLCTVMTCHLPQIEILLEYTEGQILRRRLTAPGDFDFITQHTSVHPSVAIGWFGTDEELPTLEQDCRASGDPLFKLKQRLHADVIQLNGSAGVLKQISFIPLQRHSGMIVYGITVAR